MPYASQRKVIRVPQVLYRIGGKFPVILHPALNILKDSFLSYRQWYHELKVIFHYIRECVSCFDHRNNRHRMRTRSRIMSPLFPKHALRDPPY